jgi:pimeloyl-ACP methyl ester carboxylesterase
MIHFFTSFDGTRLAYHDEGDGPPVILLHGFGVDGLGQFGEFERILPLLEKRQELFREVFGGAPSLPDPPPNGRPGLVRALLEAGTHVIVPDMRGFGASDTELQSNDDKLYSGWSEIFLIQVKPAKEATLGRSFSSAAKPFWTWQSTAS